MQKKTTTDNPKFRFPLFWKIIILSIFICVLFLVGIKAFMIKKALTFAEDFKSITKGGQIFSPLYSYYENQPFPIISETIQEYNPSTMKNYNETILNVAFPDDNISYNVAAFSTLSDVIIQYPIPSSDKIYFFSLTIYLSNGTVYESINDATTGLGTTHTFDISSKNKEKTKTNNSESKTFIPVPHNSDTYCVIIRVYKQDITFEVPSPTLVVDNKQKEYTSISQKTRKSDSNFLQKLLYLLFHLKFSKKDIETFFGVDAYQFFLPAKNLMSLVFPNEFALYLMTFPQNDNGVIQVQGTLQTDIGSTNNNCRYVSFMASNFLTTSTDASINFKTLKTNEQNQYVLFVAFSEQSAKTSGYNPSTANHNLLLWDEKSNNKPVLIYRIVSVATERNDEDAIFSLPNQIQSIGAPPSASNANSSSETLTSWTYYPKVVS